MNPARDLVVERPVATPGQAHVPDRAGDRRRCSSRRARPRRRRCSSSRRARSTPQSEMPPTLRPRYRLSAACAASSITGRPSARIGSRSAGCPARWTGMIAFVRSVTSCGDQGGVDVEIALADIAEDGRGAAVLDHVGGRGPGDRARDHLVARADADREQREVERRRAGGDGEHVLGLEVLGHALLEQRRPRAGRQPARAQRLDDGGDLLLPDRGRLEAELGATRRAHRPGSVRPAPHGEPGATAAAVSSPVARIAPALSAPRRSGPKRHPGCR